MATTTGVTVFMPRWASYHDAYVAQFVHGASYGTGHHFFIHKDTQYTARYRYIQQLKLLPLLSDLFEPARRNLFDGTRTCMMTFGRALE